MKNINMKVRDLKKLVNDLSVEYDDIPVIIPIISEEDNNNILSFRHVRTAGIVHDDCEISGGDAFILNASSCPDIDIEAQIKNRKSDVICKKVLF